MRIGIAQIIAGLIAVGVLIAGAFSFGTKWSDRESEDTAQSAAAAEAAAAPDEVAEQPEALSDVYDVIKVVDGDTIAISMNGKSETLRLIGIDTPETVDSRVEVQCFGKEASEKMKSLLQGKRVRLEYDPKEGERDKYKRLLAYVFREDGLHVNKHLIEEGYAYEYTYDTAYKYQKEFKAAEASAKSAEKGLWAPGACPPAPKEVVPAVKGKSSVSKEETPAPPSTPVPPVVQQPPAQSQTPPPQEVQPTPPPQNSGSYTCSANTYNCTDFKSQAEAQSVFEQCGGTANDVHRLDGNKDGSVCESLP
jgi:micrococcal nuclease